MGRKLIGSNYKDIHIHYTGNDKREFITSNPKAMANIHTHGMENHGLHNLCLVTAYEPGRAQEILYSIAKAEINENKDFETGVTHIVDRPNKKGGYDLIVQFLLKRVKCCGEDCLIVIEIGGSEGNYYVVHDADMMFKDWIEKEITMYDWRKVENKAN